MSKMSKMGKEHTHTLLAHNFLNTGNGFSIRNLMFVGKHETESFPTIPSNTPKGCNVYVC